MKLPRLLVLFFLPKKLRPLQDGGEEEAGDGGPHEAEVVAAEGGGAVRGAEVVAAFHECGAVERRGGWVSGDGAGCAGEEAADAAAEGEKAEDEGADGEEETDQDEGKPEAGF
ncbi:MAG: hypothetical protein Q9177_005703 [Variospora cf. flavescens]